MNRNRLGQAITAHLYEHRAIYLFTIILFVIGIIFGAIVVNSMSLVQKNDLHVYLQQFFQQVGKDEIASPVAMFAQSFAQNVKYVGLIWLLGLSIIGLPLIFVLLFLKGVVVGFTVGFLVHQIGLNGFLLAFVSIMPQNFFIVPAFVVVAAMSTAFSMKMIRKQFFQQSNEPLFPQFLRYSFLILSVGAVLCIASAFEAFISPTLMKWLVN